jgi:hypothetical protein
MPIKLGNYRHFKGGLYTVIGTARHSTNDANEGKDDVLYVDHNTGKLDSRLQKEFEGDVVVIDEYRDERTVYRFMFVGEK